MKKISFVFQGNFLHGGVLLLFCLILVLSFLTTSYAKTEDENNTISRAAVRIGEEEYQVYETAHPYGGSGIVWEQVFTWQDAGYIALHFADFDLAPGDYVEISSPDGTHIYRYDGKGKAVRGGEEVLSSFWTSHIKGDTAIVRLHSTNASGAWGLKIDKWAHGYEPYLIQEILEGGSNAEAICGSDNKEWAKCYNGTSLYDGSKTVARLLINGNSACTGWLLGNEGHLMTNNHCIASQSDADNTDYEFMAEGSSCSTYCGAQMSCRGTVEATSGTLIKANAGLDYTLVLLPTNLTAKYGYLRFRATRPTVGERIYIPQHAYAKGKQIAVKDDQAGAGVYCQINGISEPACTGGPGDIGYFCDTEAGSSGSPVIANSDHLVVALHHCAGTGYCPSAQGRNRGVSAPDIITDLGPDLPQNAVGSVVRTTMFKEDFESGTLASVWSKNSTGNGRIQVTTNYAPYGGLYHLTMDDSVSAGAYSLNELVLTIDLSGRTGVELSFYHKEFSDDDHIMPASFTGSSNSDGVAISADGTNWYKVQGLTYSDGISSSYKNFNVNLDSAIASSGISYNSAFKIKLQQYGSYPIYSDGFAFDGIEIFTLSYANNLPSSPKLIYPADIQAGLGTAVTFRWEKSTDPDMNKVTYSVYYSEDPNFTGSTPVKVTSLGNKGIYYAGTGMGLLLFGTVLPAGIRLRKKLFFMGTIMLLYIMLVVSCGSKGGGGGGGSSSNGDPGTPPSNEVTLSVSGLKTSTTYFWKVAADDGNGGVTESQVQSFKTQ